MLLNEKAVTRGRRPGWRSGITFHQAERPTFSKYQAQFPADHKTLQHQSHLQKMRRTTEVRCRLQLFLHMLSDSRGEPLSCISKHGSLLGSEWLIALSTGMWHHFVTTRLLIRLRQLHAFPHFIDESIRLHQSIPCQTRPLLFATNKDLPETAQIRRDRPKSVGFFYTSCPGPAPVSASVAFIRMLYKGRYMSCFVTMQSN